MSIRTSLTLAALAAIASPLAAQGRGNDGDRVPRGHLPPPGECRIWIDGVPPGRQPEPTDCATARRHVPRNGRVIYGERTTATRDDDRWIDRVRRDRDGRYDDRDDGRYDRDRKSADLGDRKYDDRDDGKYDDRNARKESDRRETGVRIFDNDDDDDRRDTDRKMSDRKDTARKR
jgi:hypothetical protein